MSTPTDRRHVISRHDPRLTGAEDAILSVGNGGFAAGVDRTGTQTFCGPGTAETRLNTLAEWGWHAIPGPAPGPWSSLLRDYASPRGQAAYLDLEGTTEDPGPVAGWYRENPHKVSLLRFFLIDEITGQAPAPAKITDAHQHLELWTGTLRSTFAYRGRSCEIVTVADPERDALALRIEAPGLGLMLGFPYASTAWELAADWDSPTAHSTAVDGRRVHRGMDGLEYDVAVHGARPDQVGEHRVRLWPLGNGPGAGGARGGTAGVTPHEPEGAPLDVVLELVPRAMPEGLALPEVLDLSRQCPQPRPETGAAVRERSARFWSGYWERTGVLDLGRAEDPRAHELERRAVLSRYLQRVHAAGRLPPAETGLHANSWRGKFHLEMHWWHSAHFALWGDVASLRRGLDVYAAMLPSARATARSQGCRGARWPKQIGPDLRETPSDIGPFLQWQQPHPIHLAELVRRADPSADGDAMLHELVEESALCLVDLLRVDGTGSGPVGHDLGARPGKGTHDTSGPRYGLGPPLIGAQERHVGERGRLQDPSFELAYTAWALRIADAWRAARGARDAGELTAIARRIHPPSTTSGVLSTFRAGPAVDRSDHPSHLLAHGMVPPTGTIPAAAAQAALEDVLADWDWGSTWGWDYPALAMTAARLQRPETAVEALLLPTAKNRCDGAGHFPQRPGLPAYLPANGGTLTALALMSVGWDGGPDSPGLPAHWGARHEGILPLPGPLGP